MQLCSFGPRAEPSTFDYIWKAADRSLATINLTNFVVTLKEGVQPYCQPPRAEPPHKRERISAAVSKGLEAGIHEPSESPWWPPVVLVSRPGNEAGDRLCLDHRELNNRTVVPRYPLPRIQEALDALQGKAYLSLFDIPAAYYQEEVEERSRPVLAFMRCRQRTATTSLSECLLVQPGLRQPTNEWLVTSSLA
ncbi:hypothetical protein Efla_001351 [Eimeria flavescens]